MEETTVNATQETTDGTIPKATYDKKVSELNAELKKAKAELKTRMSDDEKTAQEAAERQKELEGVKAELAQIKSERKFLANGYDAETASALASAIAGGDIDAFIAAHQKWTDAKKSEYEKAIKAEIDKKTPAIKNNNTTVEQEKEDEDVAYGKMFAQRAKANSESAKNTVKAYM